MVGLCSGTLGPGRWARCCKKEGGWAGGFDLRTLCKAPPLCPEDSVRRRNPLPSPHPQSIPSPASWGRHFPSQTLVEPSWSQVGISPLGSPSHPTPCHPQNLGFNVYFIIRMPAMREPPEGPSVGRWGTGKGHVYSLLPSPSPGERRASQGRRGP